MILRFAPLLLVFAAACGPEPECGWNASCLRPAVYVDVCADPQFKAEGEILGGVRDCSVDFGVVGAFGAERVARFSNPLKVPVAVEVALASDDFELVSAPTTVEPAFPEDAVFRAKPGVEGNATAVVTTDAANILGDTIEIELVARDAKAALE